MDFFVLKKSNYEPYGEIWKNAGRERKVTISAENGRLTLLLR